MSKVTKKWWFKAVDYVLILAFFVSMFAGITIPADKGYAADSMQNESAAVVEAVDNVIQGDNEILIKVSSSLFDETRISGEITYPDGVTKVDLPSVSNQIYRDGDRDIIVELEQPFVSPTVGDSEYTITLQEQMSDSTYRSMTPNGSCSFKVVPDVALLNASNEPFPDRVLSSGTAEQEIRVPLAGIASEPKVVVGLMNMDNDWHTELDNMHSGVYSNNPDNPSDDMAWAKLPFALKPGNYGIGIMNTTEDGDLKLKAASRFGVQGITVVDDLEPGRSKQTRMIAVGTVFPQPVTSIVFDNSISVKNNYWNRIDDHTVALEVYAPPYIPSSVEGTLYNGAVNGMFTPGVITVKTVLVSEVQNGVVGEDFVKIFGSNLDMVDANSITGAVYSGYEQIAVIDNLNYMQQEMGFMAQLAPMPEVGIYTVKLLRNGVPFGGQSSYQFRVVPPVGIDVSFEGTQQKIQVMPNDNIFGSDITLLKAVIKYKEGIVQDSVCNSIYNLEFSESNLVFAVPDSFNLKEFAVEIYNKDNAGAPYEFVSRGFFGMNFGPQYAVGPEAVMPGDTNIFLDIFGPGFNGSSTVQMYVYSADAWIVDDKITLGSISVINDVPYPGVHLRTGMSVPNDAAKGLRKIRVTTGSSVVDIDNKFRVMMPMNITISDENIIIDPNGNPIGTTDPSKLKLRVFTGQYPLPDITSGFSIDGSGHIVVPFAVRPELKFAKGFGVDLLRIEGDKFTFVGKGEYMKPSVGPDRVMPGILNIPLDIWAPDLTSDSTVSINVYNKDIGNWVNDSNFILDNLTRKIIEEPGNIGGVQRHYQVMMSVKQTAEIGLRQIVVSGSGAVVIDNALTVMPNANMPPPPGTDIPFMATGSNVEEMGTVSPDIMFIGIVFTRDINVSDVNRTVVKDAIEIVKLDEGGSPVGEPIDGTVMNPPTSSGSTNTTMEKNVVMFKPASALEGNSTYRLTIVQGTVQSTDGKPQVSLANTYEATFTTGQVDAAAPEIIKVETMPSPTEGKIAFMFSKPMAENEAKNSSNYAINVNGTIRTAGTIEYDSMMNVAVLRGFNLALNDTITGTVGGIHSTSGVLMSPYNINTTVKGFEIGSGSMSNTQRAFSPIEVRPTNPSAQAEAHYIIRMPIQQRLAPGDKIDVVFPAGFNVAAAALDSGSPMNNDINGSGAGIVTIRSVATESISRTVTVTMNVYTADDVQDFLQFELKGIVNGAEKAMQFDSTTGAPIDGYYTIITTKSSAGTVKEGPMNSMMFPIAKAASGSIDGIIRNNSGTPIANIKVYLGGPTGMREGLTDSDGKFSFTALVPGGYFLTTESSPDGGAYVGITMPRQYIIERLGENSYTQLTAENNIVVLGSAASYNSLAVSITSGIQMAGKQVDVFAGSPTAFIVQTITLDNSGNGTATLKVQNDSYMVGVGPAMPKGGAAGSIQLDWMPPMPVKMDIQGNTNVNISIDLPNATIMGTVKDGNDNVIPNAEVYAYSPSGNTMGSRAVTDSAGTFSLKVKPGEYVVGTHAAGMPWIAEKKVSIGSSQTAAVNFKFQALEVAISGTVVDSDGRPISKASIIAYAVDSNNINTAKPLSGFANAVTDTSGNFNLFVRPNSFWVLSGFVPNFGELPKQLVTVEASNKSGVQITVQTSTMGTVKGRITIGVDPVANAGIWAEGTNIQYGNRATTNSNGDYSIKLKQGQYRLHIWTPETGEIPLDNSQALISVTDVVYKDFTLPVKGSITVNFGSEPKAGFEAYVNARSTDGRYQNGGYVKLIDDASLSNEAKVRINVPVGNDGTSYNLKIYVPGIGDSGTVAEFSGKTAQLTVVQAAYEVSVALPASLKTISGIVKIANDSGAPVSNAWVSISKKNSPFGAYKKTDSGGNFEFKVPDGAYVLTADHTSYTPTPSVTVTVSESMTQNLFVDVLGDVTVSGSIYKDSIITGNEIGANAVIWATSQDGRWVGGEVNSNSTYSLRLPNINATWLIEAAADGYETSAVNKPKIVISGGQSVSGVNVLTSKMKIGGVDYEVKPPEVTTITPATGGVVNSQETGVKITLPANALGSSTDAGQITTKETTSIPVTLLARPAGSVGMEIKAADSAGASITKLNDYIDIELDYSSLLDPNDSTKLSVGISVYDLQLGYWDDTAKNWVFIAATNDTVNHVLRGKVDHLTTFAPLVSTGEGVTGTPSGLSASAVSSSRIDLDWEAVSGAASYNVYRALTANGDYSKINTTTVTSPAYSNTGLTAGTAYYYKISAVNATGESSASDYAAATTVVAVPSTPAGLTAGIIATTSIAMSWSTASGAAGYKLYKSTVLDGTYDLVYSGSGTSFTDTGLTAATTYYYKVSATNAGGESVLSAAVSTATSAESIDGLGGNSPASSVQEQKKTSEDVAKLVEGIDTTTDPVKAAEDLSTLINDNKELLTDVALKNKITETAAKIVQNVTLVDSTKLNVTETTTTTVVQIKDDQLKTIIDNAAKVVEDLKTLMAANQMTEEAKQLKKEVVISIAGISAEKEVKLMLPESIVNKVAEKSVNIAVEGEDVKLLLPASALQLKELGDASQKAKQEGKTACVEISSKSINEAITLDSAMKHIGKTYEFGVSVVLKDSLGNVDEDTRQNLTRFAGKVSVEMKYSDQEVKNVVNLDKLGVYTLDEATGKWNYVRSRIDKENKKLMFDTPHFSKYAVIEYNKTFTDVPDGHWAKDYIELLAAKHITTGVDENNFKPEGVVSRAQFAAFIVRALDIEEGSYEGIFSDVGEGVWYQPGVEAAAKADLVRGTGAGRFNPNTPVTREEMAVMIMRGYQYLTRRNIADEAKKSTINFTDRGNVSEWAKDAVLAAQANGIINGITETTFAPKERAQRDQAAKMLIQLLKVCKEL